MIIKTMKLLNAELYSKEEFVLFILLLMLWYLKHRHPRQIPPMQMPRGSC